ncbi:hypothetical protein QBZ16_003409 [Prototheca wickerhamii]|uniref:Phosphate acetyltransferase n=1 Tax=Prototheca wickerhamii TaxID=3111 RepID=A0AAD9MHH3_PROWI|nr:hypothetical protein QBZ16_003409 [Prototheca wickerhamii]
MSLSSSRSLRRTLGLLRPVAASTPLFARHLSSRGIPDADTVYCTDVSAQRGNSPILLGLFEYFQRQSPDVGFFQPIGADPLKSYRPAPGAPKHIALIHQAMGLKDSPESMYGVTEDEAKRLLTAGRYDELVDRVFTKFQAVKRSKEIVVIEGATVQGIGNHNELNARLASELDSGVLMIMDLNRDAPGSGEDIAGRALRYKREFEAERARVSGLILNKVPFGAEEVLIEAVRRELEGQDLPFAGGLPYSRVIGTARVNEIVESLGAKLLFGRHELIDSDVTGYMIAAQAIDAFLTKLETLRSQRTSEGQDFFRPLVVTNKDRQDLILGLAAASLAGTGPQLGGLILADADLTDLTPETRAIVSKLNPDLPMLEVPYGTFETARRLTRVTPGILPSSVRKVREAKALFHKYVDADVIAAGLVRPQRPSLTPKRFLYQIEEICKGQLQNVVLPESHDHRVLTAAAEVAAKGLARVTLLGNPEEVASAARRFNVDISKCDVIDYKHSPALDRYADWLVEKRKAKGLTKEGALDQLQDLNMYATVMVAVGDADGMVSGATCTTANTIRPALQVLKTPDRKLVSSIFFMCLPDKVLVYGDCAVNVTPSPGELAQIATVSADTAAAFGIDARVAMLSYSTLGSGSGPQVDMVTEATRLAREARPDLNIEGPIQYDAAVDPAVAATKIKSHSEVAGRASVCIFPDLNTGNNTYKAVQQSTGAIAIGPLMQGLARPVNDLSRGCTVADIVNTVACTAVQAIGLKARDAEAARAGAAAAA